MHLTRDDFGAWLGRYFDEDGAIRDEYSYIFVCRFDDAGRCSELSEWRVRIPGPETA